MHETDCRRALESFGNTIFIPRAINQSDCYMMTVALGIRGTNDRSKGYQRTRVPENECTYYLNRQHPVHPAFSAALVVLVQYITTWCHNSEFISAKFIMSGRILCSENNSIFVT
jgi:hypothetical protein